MELYERVDELIDYAGKSRASLAKQLKIKQTTFNGYFTREKQKNLWPFLQEILAHFPQTSREWLFFGEGEMLIRKDMDLPLVSQSREKELLLKIEQLSSLVIKLENQGAGAR